MGKKGYKSQKVAGVNKKDDTELFRAEFVNTLFRHKDLKCAFLHI